MTSTPRAVGAALLTALVLASSAACQTADPGPIPTATLPTPTPPSTQASPATASPEQPTEQAITEAAQSYLEGRVLAEDLYKARDIDRLHELDSYFTDGYLDFWKEDLASYIDAGLEYQGEVGLSVVSAKNYQADSGSSSFELVTCLSFLEVEWIDANGSEIEKPFQTAIEDVTVIKSDQGAWVASSASTEPVDSFAGTDCEGTQ